MAEGSISKFYRFFVYIFSFFLFFKLLTSYCAMKIRWREKRKGKFLSSIIRSVCNVSYNSFSSKKYLL